MPQSAPAWVHPHPPYEGMFYHPTSQYTKKRRTRPHTKESKVRHRPPKCMGKHYIIRVVRPQAELRRVCSVCMRMHAISQNNLWRVPRARVSPTCSPSIAVEYKSKGSWRSILAGEDRVPVGGPRPARRYVLMANRTHASTPTALRPAAPAAPASADPSSRVRMLTCDWSRWDVPVGRADAFDRR